MQACWDEGELRAYLDDELQPAAKGRMVEHLATCALCRARLADLEARASRTSILFTALAPAQGEAGPAPAQALARFHARQERSGVLLPTLKSMKWRSIMDRFSTRNWRPALALLATAVVLAFAFSLAPVRSAASQFLSIFRVRQFAALSLSPAQVQNLEQGLAGLDNLLAGQMEMIEEPGPPREVESLEEATAFMGFPVRAPTTLPAGISGQPTIRLQDGGKGRFGVDVARVQALLDALGRDDLRVPPALDGATVEVDIPRMAILTYGAMAGHPLAFIQMESPTVTLPPGVSLAQLGEIGLQVLGLTPEEARAFSARIDWASTLVIPVPTDIVSFREVTVDGVSGLLLQERRSEYGPAAVLMWQKGGVVYALSGQASPEDLLSMANSLR